MCSESLSRRMLLLLCFYRLCGWWKCPNPRLKSIFHSLDPGNCSETLSHKAAWPKAFQKSANILIFLKKWGQPLQLFHGICPADQHHSDLGSSPQVLFSMLKIFWNATCVLDTVTTLAFNAFLLDAWPWASRLYCRRRRRLQVASVLWVLGPEGLMAQSAGLVIDLIKSPICSIFITGHKKLLDYCTMQPSRSWRFYSLLLLVVQLMMENWMWAAALVLWLKAVKSHWPPDSRAGDCSYKQRCYQGQQSWPIQWRNIFHLQNTEC